MLEFLVEMVDSRVGAGKIQGGPGISVEPASKEVHKHHPQEPPMAKWNRLCNKMMTDWVSTHEMKSVPTGPCRYKQIVG